MSKGLVEKKPGSGGLHKELFVIFTTPVASREKILKILPKHLERQVELERKGILFAAGPMFEEGVEGAVRGMVVIRASSFEEARKIADEDPLHAAGLRSYTIDRWIINEGSYSVNVKYSDQTMQIK
ncbi:MAG: hypothetical protein CMM67_01470 [Rhodospirillaceae bacterium]|nr:hypothetical protein [Rhodospirillaceae bacterium]OUT80477.1 MAG: hypothetical protein CBB83_01355 [Rhodospirillaceae bacterium TMED23]|tara:strand:- start:2299 stop:2676 length:378 start_codon:yes stop_codon:yes gene_type:complete